MLGVFNWPIWRYCVPCLCLGLSCGSHAYAFDYRRSLREHRSVVVLAFLGVYIFVLIVFLVRPLFPFRLLFLVDFSVVFVVFASTPRRNGGGCTWHI